MYNQPFAFIVTLRDRIPMHFVERLKLRASMESGVMWTWFTVFKEVCLFA